MKNATQITIPIITSREFFDIVLRLWTKQFEGGTVTDIGRYTLIYGCPSLDFSKLNEVLPKLQVCVPLMAVEFDDENYIWIVSGSNAILSRK